MKKSSLGRRNSNRPSTAVGRPSADVSTIRKSGIPLSKSRARSTERQSATNFPGRINRAASSSNLNMLDMMTPAKTPLSSRFQFGVGTERPARTTSYGTPSASVGTSSYGGHKSKRDNRPLQDKEWQAQALNFVENIIDHDPNGRAVIGPGLKPLSLTKFIEASELLLKMLDGSVNVTKHTYLKELPFLLGKRMMYKGKMEKSWMVAVSTQHAVPYAIGLLHFLAQCVNLFINVDIESLMFPSQFDNNQAGEMNFQLLIPYYNRSHQLKKSNSPNIEAIQEELNRQVMQDHYEQDDALSRKEIISEEMEMNTNEIEKIAHERDLAQQEFEALANEYKIITKDISDKEALMVKCKIQNSAKCDKSNVERSVSTAESELKYHKDEYEKLLKKAEEQSITLRDIENVKKKRDSLDRSIVSNQKYIQGYQDMIYSEDIEVLKLKTEAEELTRESNLGILKYVRIEPEFEKMILPTKIEEFDSSRVALQKAEVEKLKIKCEARSMDLLSEKSSAEHKRDEASKLVSELKAANEAKRAKNDLLLAERESLLDASNKLKISFGLEWERLQSEREILEKQLHNLTTENGAKLERVKKLQNDKGLCEKMLIERVRALGASAAAALIEMKKVQEEIKKSINTTPNNV